MVTLKGKWYNKQLLILMIVIVLMVIFFMGGSYALVSKVTTGSNTYSLTVGNFFLEFTDNNVITLENSYPISDVTGLSQLKEFTFKIHNNGDYTASYTLSIEETSKESLGKAIKYVYNLNNNGYTEIAILDEKPNIVQNMILKSGESDSYRMKFWIDINADAFYMNKTFSARIVANATQSEYKYATNVLEKLADEKKDGVLGFDNNGLYSTLKISEYRYIGSYVSNYLWFNCQDGYTKGEKYCEKWRIVGEFNNTWENGSRTYNSLKIVRNDAINTSMFKETEINNYFNDTLISFYLNNDYYDSLSNNAQKMILRGRWNNNIINDELSVSNFYMLEKDNYYYANVGLVSISDYGYISGVENLSSNISNITITKENNWLYADKECLTMSIITKNNQRLFNIVSGLNQENIVNTNKLETVNFKPSVYLRPDVSIIGGMGTIDNPYEIEINFPMSYDKVISSNYITYDTNGGVMEKNIQLIETSGITTLYDFSPTKKDFTFVGWSKNLNGEVFYKPGDTIYVNTNLTLYAVWK